MHNYFKVQSTSGNSNPQGNEKSVRDSECSSYRTDFVWEGFPREK